MVVGRGSSIEAFPLFGYSLDDYDSLFAENLDLLLAIRKDEHVRWSGRHRAPLAGKECTLDRRRRRCPSGLEWAEHRSPLLAREHWDCP